MVNKSDNPIIDAIRVRVDESGNPDDVKATIAFDKRDELTHSDYDEVVAEGIQKLLDNGVRQAPQRIAVLGFILDDSVDVPELEDKISDMDRFKINEMFGLASTIYADKEE